MSDYKIIHTDGTNRDFIELCKMLDQNLDEIVGGVFQREKYQPFNTLEDIHDVVVIYQDEHPIACGSFKHLDDTTAEIKRVFVRNDARGNGISRLLMQMLENKARTKDFKRLVLETGEPLQAAIGLYRKIGFNVIENYGPYIDMKESVCMEKWIDK